MKLESRHFMQRIALVMVLSSGLLLSIVPPAAAHKVEFRPVISKHHYYQQTRHGRSFIFPRWLKKDRDFQRWFLRSDYRHLHGHIRGANWRQLYGRYRHETQHLRRRNRHIESRVYFDLSHLPGHRHR